METRDLKTDVVGVVVRLMQVHSIHDSATASGIHTRSWETPPFHNSWRRTRETLPTYIHVRTGKKQTFVTIVMGQVLGCQLFLFCQSASFSSQFLLRNSLPKLEQKTVKWDSRRFSEKCKFETRFPSQVWIKLVIV